MWWIMFLVIPFFFFFFLVLTVMNSDVLFDLFVSQEYRGDYRGSDKLYVCFLGLFC